MLTVCPGYVRTDFSANAVRGKEAEDRCGPSAVRGISAERVARAVLARLSEAEAGSGRALDHASGHQDLPVVSRVVERAMLKMAKSTD